MLRDLGPPQRRAMKRTVTRAVRIGLLGAGVVGQGILSLLADNATSIERRLGAAIVVRRVVARDQDKARPLVPPELLSFRAEDVLDDDDVDIVVEVIGGVGRRAATCGARSSAVSPW
jgi:homoserine dehydrogenase